ncbi:MAG: HepT-like ribonuclease domain-containing protein [Hydrogenothermaceae bacterium]
MIDIEFLNQKATKLKSTLKNIKMIIEKGEETFLSTPMYPDRIKYYLVIASDFLEEIACHLLKEITQKVQRENCLKEISGMDIFSPKLNRTFQDFVEFKRKLFEENFNYSERELYHLTRDIVSTIDSLFIPELSIVVKQLKEKSPKLKIPVNLVKINKNLSVMKSELKRIQTFESMSFEEFSSNDFAVDRTRYFLTVYIDSAMWICRHISRQAKINNKRCFEGLTENRIISKETAEILQDISDKREVIANPTAEVDKSWLYNLIKKDLKTTTENFIKELSKSLIES